MSQLPSMKLPPLFQQQEKKESSDEDRSKMMLLYHKESYSPMVFHHDSHYYKMSTKTTTTTTDILLPPILTNPTIQQTTNSAFAPLSPPYSTCSSALSVSSSPSSPSSFAGNSFSSYSTSTTKKGSIQSLLNSGSELLELEKHEYSKKRPLDNEDDDEDVVFTDNSMSNKMQKITTSNNNNGRQIKGLRLFSKQVYDKVAEKKTTTYNQVADELAADIQSNHQQPNNIDGKNIRRRVYDALNVFMALNLISKNRKEIKWLGFEHHHHQQQQQQQHDALLEEEIQYEEARQQMLLHSIKKDQIKCDNAWLDLNKLNQLVQRNRQHQQKTTAVIQFPFFLIQGKDMETIYHHSNEACVTSLSSSIVYKDVDILAKIWPSPSTVVL